ncbi:cytochrome P450 [Backusella circina FSU 941]|nr:cytochrome P450 [Backusella circina FSU 941]
MAASAFAVLYSAYQYYKKEDDHTGIPTPDAAYPYLGHLLSLGDVPSTQISKWHDQYGPIIRVKMGIQNWIFVSDPLLAQKIFVGSGIYSSARPYSTFSTKHYSHGGQGLVFSDDNKSWKEARTAVLAVLAPKNVEKYIPAIENESDSLVNRLLKATQEQGGVEAYQFLELNSTNIITSVLVGVRYTSEQDPDFVEGTTLGKIGARLVGIDMDLPLFLPILKPFTYFFGIEKKMGNFIKNMQRPFMQKLVKKAVMTDGPNMIKEFQKEGYSFTDVQKVVIISDLLAAGTETVSATMTWLFTIVCHMPEVQTRLQAEIDTFIRSHQRLPSFSERLEFPYMIAVIKETMRFKSATPFGIPHKATKDISVDGYIIPGGSVLISSNEHMHTKSSFYKNGHLFDPERYMGDDRLMFSAANGRVNERDHFNFGWGRRICPGSYLAEVEIFCMIVRIFSRCHVEAPKDINGKAIIPDLNDHVYRGITTLPKEHQIRFVERKDKLL